MNNYNAHREQNGFKIGSLTLEYIWHLPIDRALKANAEYSIVLIIIVHINGLQCQYQMVKVNPDFKTFLIVYN